MYQVIADENELKWFYDNVIQRPKVNESYSMVFVCRHKKLTDEEKQRLGLTRSKGEFLNTQSVRLRTKSGDKQVNLYWDFGNFLQHVKRFNVDDGAYQTETGEKLPDKTLAVLFYVNPCDDIKVAERLQEQLEETKMAIMKAYLNGKDVNDSITNYRVFGNIESNVKHLKANCKGSIYYIDYDLDVPSWWKEKYYKDTKEIIEKYYPRGSYYIVNTSGGYHILCKSKVIHFDPHNLCKDFQDFYCGRVNDGEKPYLNDKGEDKFECILNDSQIPGIPLPGTYQYGNTVYVVNKEDFMTKEELENELIRLKELEEGITITGLGSKILEITKQKIEIITKRLDEEGA